MGDMGMQATATDGREIDLTQEQLDGLKMRLRGRCSCPATPATRTPGPSGTP